MEQIIGALITAAATFLSVIFVELLVGKSTHKLLETHNDDSKNKHEQLSKEHVAITERLTSLLKSIIHNLASMNSVISSINSIVTEEKGKQELRYSVLNDSQKDIKSHVDAIKELARDWEGQALKIKILENRVSELIDNIESLSTENRELKDENQELKNELKKSKNKNRGMER